MWMMPSGNSQLSSWTMVLRLGTLCIHQFLSSLGGSVTVWGCVVNWIMELIWASSNLGKYAVSNFLQQSNPVYSIEVWNVAPLKLQGEEQKNWLRRGICKSGALTVTSVYVIMILVNQRESVSERSVGADLSEFDVRNKRIFVGCFLQNCLQTL